MKISCKQTAKRFLSVQAQQSELLALYQNFRGGILMIKKSAPLSQTQLGIYFDCMQEASAYNVHRILTLDADIDLH